MAYWFIDYVVYGPYKKCNNNLVMRAIKKENIKQFGVFWGRNLFNFHTNLDEIANNCDFYVRLQEKTLNYNFL